MQSISTALSGQPLSVSRPYVPGTWLGRVKDYFRAGKISRGAVDIAECLVGNFRYAGEHRGTCYRLVRTLAGQVARSLRQTRRYLAELCACSLLERWQGAERRCNNFRALTPPPPGGRPSPCPGGADRSDLQNRTKSGTDLVVGRAVARHPTEPDVSSSHAAKPEPSAPPHGSYGGVGRSETPQRTSGPCQTQDEDLEDQTPPGYLARAKASPPDDGRRRAAAWLRSFGMHPAIVAWLSERLETPELEWLASESQGARHVHRYARALVNRLTLGRAGPAVPVPEHLWPKGKASRIAAERATWVGAHFDANGDPVVYKTRAPEPPPVDVLAGEVDRAFAKLPPQPLPDRLRLALQRMSSAARAAQLVAWRRRRVEAAGFLVDADGRFFLP